MRLDHATMARHSTAIEPSARQTTVTPTKKPVKVNPTIVRGSSPQSSARRQQHLSRRSSRAAADDAIVGSIAIRAPKKTKSRMHATTITTQSAPSTRFRG